MPYKAFEKVYATSYLAKPLEAFKTGFL